MVREERSDLPIRGISDALAARFRQGDRIFEGQFRESQGLGPIYIRAACAACHADDGRGPGSVTKVVKVDNDGMTPAADQSMFSYGHSVRSQLAAGATRGVLLPEPSDGFRVSKRVGPAIFGRGYIEAIADEEIERVEAEQSARSDGISGRIHRVTRASETNPDTTYHRFEKGQSNLIGRFGLKARIATIDDFAADAFQGDMGITSDLRPNELPNPDNLTDDLKPGVDVSAETVNAVADYARLVDIPHRAEPDARGQALFTQIGCAVCHVPSLRTRAEHPIPQLAAIDAPVYTDLLLHDMGDALADGLDEGQASWREWRTAPLIGLRLFRTYLHDGRAKSVDEAVRLHSGRGSESNDVVDAFLALDEGDRARLLAFVLSL